MFRNREKQSYKIFKRVMYDPGYRAVAEEYRRAVDVLQSQSLSFTPEQRKAVADYQNAFTKLHQAMLTIALKRRII